MKIAKFCMQQYEQESTLGALSTTHQWNVTPSSFKEETADVIAYTCEAKK